MGMADWFGWTRQGGVIEGLGNIYPMPITDSDFIAIDIQTIYTKILTDVLERTNGLKDEQVALMWDNCLKSEKADGLITLLSKAMAGKLDLFLVYEPAVNVLREADSTEQAKIREDYAKQGKSAAGIFISFSNYRRSDMIRFYLALSYCTATSLWKVMNLARAIQLKISDLRKSVGLADSEDVKDQAKRISAGLGRGEDVLLDENDTIETATPDLSATKEAVSFVDAKLAFYLGLPDSYLSGEQTAGIGSSGENDMRAIERGLKGYFVSVVKPVLDTLFGIKTQYKTQDFSMIQASVEILKVFALIDDTLVSADNKRKILNGLLGLPEDAKGDPAPKPDPKILAVPPPAKPGAEATA